MIEVPMQHSEDLIEEDDAQEINPIDALNPEINPNEEINPEKREAREQSSHPEINDEEPAPAPKKRGRPRKAPPPPPPPAPSPVPKRKAPKAAPKAKVVQQKPPRERARAEEESYPQANPFDSISSTELVAELLGRRAAEDRDRTRHMYRSWLS